MVNVLKKTLELGFRCIACLALCLFIYIINFLMFTFISDLGTVTTLSCERVKPTQVNCEKTRSLLFGLVPQPSSSMFMVTEAIVNSESTTLRKRVRKSQIVNNSVILVTKYDGEFPAFYDLVSHESDEREMKVLATRINTFIQSNQPSLIVKRKGFSQLEDFLVLVYVFIWLLLLGLSFLFFLIFSFGSIWFRLSFALGLEVCFIVVILLKINYKEATEATVHVNTILNNF